MIAHENTWGMKPHLVMHARTGIKASKKYVWACKGTRFVLKKSNHTHTHTQVCTHTSMHTHARTSTQRATVAADFMLLTRRKKEQERKEEEEEERTSTGKGTSCLAAPAVNRLSFLGADQTTWWSWRGQRWRR